MSRYGPVFQFWSRLIGTNRKKATSTPSAMQNQHIDRQHKLHSPLQCSSKRLLIQPAHCPGRSTKSRRSLHSSSVTHTELSLRLLAITSNASAVNSAWMAASLEMRIFSRARLASPSLSMKGARRLSQRLESSATEKVSGLFPILRNGKELTTNIRMPLRRILCERDLSGDVKHEACRHC